MFPVAYCSRVHVHPFVTQVGVGFGQNLCGNLVHAFNIEAYAERASFHGNPVLTENEIGTVSGMNKCCLLCLQDLLLLATLKFVKVLILQDRVHGVETVLKELKILILFPFGLPASGGSEHLKT